MINQGYRHKIAQSKQKNETILLLDILITLDTAGLFIQTWLGIIIALIIAITAWVLIPLPAHSLAVISVTNLKGYHKIMAGSTLIIYGIDCGIILLTLIKGL